MPDPVTRRSFLRAAGAGAVVATSGVPAMAGTATASERADVGVSAYAFPLSAVSLLPGTFADNRDRTLKYLTFVDADRLLYTFRTNAGLPTSAQPVGGWDAPTHDLRGHTAGHLMTSLAQAWASTGTASYRTKGDYLVSSLAACQARATTRGFRAGYLSAFPESFFDRVETAQRVQAPYYTIHKIMAGLLDMHLLAGNAQALTVLTALAGWVKARTDRLSTTSLANTQNSEFGGIGETLISLYQLTGNADHLTTARRFRKPAFLSALAAGQDRLKGLHANTHLPTVLASLRDFQAGGSTQSRDIAANFWDILLDHYTYVMGGSSSNEFWRGTDQIAQWLTDTTCEGCCTYNMLKLTRQLFFTYPTRLRYVDYYERAMFNHILGQQDVSAPNGGGYAYFTPLRAGGIKTYSTDYATFSCCQGTGMESNTKYQDSIYAFAGDTLYVNLFIASRLRWPGRGITIRQDTTFPASTTSRLTVQGSGHIALKIRVPGWTSGMAVRVNGVTQRVTATPGSYVTLDRTWASGDVVDLTVPATLSFPRANDDAGVGSAVYGPIVLAGQYGTTDVGAARPGLKAGTVRQDAANPLRFTASTDTGRVALSPLYRTHHQRYVTYWSMLP